MKFWVIQQHESDKNFDGTYRVLYRVAGPFATREDAQVRANDLINQLSALEIIKGYSTYTVLSDVEVTEARERGSDVR
jgi:hypothetical protein